MTEQENGRSLKYPVLLVHGMGFRDRKHFCYWGRIPKKLRELGCSVFFGGQDSNADVETNALHLARRIDEILLETGAEKVNIIAHSKGGLESRYLISKLGMADKVASLTTISTPHNGSRSVDLLMKFPRPLIKLGCVFVDLWFRILGDKKPNTYGAICSFLTESAKRFNEEVRDSESVFYQSYAFVMKNPTSDIFLWYTNLFVSLVEGENDGLLTPEAVKWGEFKGIYRGAGRRGISHCDEVDLRRHRLSKKNGEGVPDIIGLYADMVADLASRGF